jgi:hypothetical protein
MATRAVMSSAQLPATGGADKTPAAGTTCYRSCAGMEKAIGIDGGPHLSGSARIGGRPFLPWVRSLLPRGGACFRWRERWRWVRGYSGMAWLMLRAGSAYRSTSLFPETVLADIAAAERATRPRPPVGVIDTEGHADVISAHRLREPSSLTHLYLGPPAYHRSPYNKIVSKSTTILLIEWAIMEE